MVNYQRDEVKMQGDQGRFFNITGASIWMQLSVKENLCWPFKKISKLKSSWERRQQKTIQVFWRCDGPS